jgi:hypothetical protein
MLSSSRLKAAPAGVARQTGAAHALTRARVGVGDAFASERFGKRRQPNPVENPGDDAPAKGPEGLRSRQPKDRYGLSFQQ